MKLFYFSYEYLQFTASVSIYIFEYFMLLAASRRPPLATHVTPHVISDRAAPIDKDGGAIYLFTILHHNTIIHPVDVGFYLLACIAPKGIDVLHNYIHSVTHFYAKWRMGITLYNVGYY